VLYINFKVAVSVSF